MISSESSVPSLNIHQQLTKGVTREGQRQTRDLGPSVGAGEFQAISWPSLGAVGLREHEKAERKLGIGGSDVNIILSGDSKRITRLWLEKRGAPAEDLSDKLQVSLGA